MNLKRVLAGLLAVTVFAVQPVQDVRAEDENAQLEAEKRASLEIPADTNSLENWPEGPAVYAQSAIVIGYGEWSNPLCEEAG